MSATVEIAGDLAAIDELERDWRALAERQGNAFVSPDWYRAWFEVCGEAARPAIAVRRDAEGALAGVWPLVATGRGPLRALRFAGAGFGDRFEPLDRESPAELAGGALARLRAAGDRSALVLDKVDPEAAWVHALRAGDEAIGAREHLAGVLPEVEIAGLTWEEYLAGRSRNLRSQLGRRRRKLEREHEVEFRLSDAERLAGDLDAFFRLHRGRWEGRGGSAALNDRTIAFHRRFARAALERGWLRLWVVEADGEAVAAWYGWHVGDSYSYYLAGFDERYSSYSIGTLLLAHTIESAIGEEAGVYELLLGTEEFKLRFATGERRVETLLVTPRAHPSRALYAGETAVRRGLARLSPEARERVKRPLRALAGRHGTSEG